MKGAEDRGDRRGARRDMRRRLGTKAMGKRREVQERRREIRGIHPRLPFSYVLGPGGVTISNSIALTPPGLSLAGETSEASAARETTYARNSPWQRGPRPSPSSRPPFPSGVAGPEPSRPAPARIASPGGVSAPPSRSPLGRGHHPGWITRLQDQVL